MPIKNWWPFRRKKKKVRIGNADFYSLTKVYTPVSELTLGMYVVELDRPWLGTTFLFQGFELTTKEEIKAVRDICQYVYIDMTKRKRIDTDSSTNKNNKSINQTDLPDYNPPKKLSGFQQEIVRAENIYINTELLVSDFMIKAAKGSSVDGWLAKKAVAECVSSVLHSPDAMLWLTQLKNKHEYTVQHSLNVSVLAIVLGRHINLPEDKLNILGLCGMMHDIGKMLIPVEILNKPDKLSDEEKQIIQTHTTLGYEILRSSDYMHASVMETALTHHERLDGKGYPRQIKPTGISDFAKIIGIVDAYDAITSNRVYQSGRTHLEATQIMAESAGTQLDKHLVTKFIESLGVYPPGCIVIMTNGAIGIVVEVNEEMKLRPKIILILDEEKNPVSEQLIDLSEMVNDRKGEVYTIKNVVRGEDWGIDPNKYYQEGLLQKTFSLTKKRTR